MFLGRSGRSPYCKSDSGCLSDDDDTRAPHRDRVKRLRASFLCVLRRKTAPDDVSTRRLWPRYLEVPALVFVEETKTARFHKLADDLKSRLVVPLVYLRRNSNDNEG